MKQPTKLHIIQSGDTFYSLARKYNTTVDYLTSINENVNVHSLSIGQGILVPMPPIGEQFITEGEKYLGVPYEFGATSGKTFDCSGFIQKVVQDVAGITIPRTSNLQYREGEMVSLKEAKPGDVLAWENTGSHRPRDITHIGFFVREGVFLGAQASTGVAFANYTTSYWSSRFVGVSRLVDSEGRQLPYREHTIASGDTLYAIARQYNTTVEVLTKLNPPMQANNLRIGSVLKLK